MTEIEGSDGGWVQTLSGGCYGFDSPAALAVDGTHLWVANSNIDQTGGSVTEVSTASGGSYHFVNPGLMRPSAPASGSSKEV